MRNFLFAASIAVLFISCVGEKEKSPALPEARIERLSPDRIMAGQPFNVQPNGASALSVLGANLVKGSRIKLNGTALETASGDGTSLATTVPVEMFSKEGSFIVTVETPDGRSTNSLAWIVLPKTGPTPAIAALFPATTKAGQAFNVQPNGITAMGMTGANFLPGAKILFDKTELETSFGDSDKLGAIVPASLFAKPGKIKVTVKNTDGKVSEPREFTVTP